MDFLLFSYSKNIKNKGTSKKTRNKMARKKKFRLHPVAAMGIIAGGIAVVVILMHLLGVA